VSTEEVGVGGIVAEVEVADAVEVAETVVAGRVAMAVM